MYTFTPRRARSLRRAVDYGTAVCAGPARRPGGIAPV